MATAGGEAGVSSAAALQREADAINLISDFLAKRDAPDLEALPQSELLVVCGGSVLPVVYATARLLQLGKAPRALITGGTGHATVELYRAVERHPFWGRVLPPPRGRTEASVFRDMLLALGVAPEQLLPLEEDSTNCGGNAELSMRLAVEREGLKPQRIIMLQDPTMQLRTHASFTRWWRQAMDPTNITSYSVLRPRVRVRAAGDGTNSNAAAPAGVAALEFVPESVAMVPPASEEQLQAWQEAAAAAGSRGDGQDEDGGDGCDAHHALSDRVGVWRMERFVSLVLGEVPRLRDAPGGYGPKGLAFIDHVDLPPEVEAAHAWLAARHTDLLRT